MSDIPTQLQVGPYVFKVKYLDSDRDLGELYGECDVRNQTIWLSANQAHDQMADSLLHETLHAIWHCSGLYDGRYTEEQVIRGIATWLLLVLRENETLVEFLTYNDGSLVAEIAEQLKAAAAAINATLTVETELGGTVQDMEGK